MTFFSASFLASLMLVALTMLGKGNGVVESAAESVSTIGCSRQAQVQAPSACHDHDGSVPYAEGRFGCDLRQPRRPRHRSERPVFVAIDVGLDRVNSILSSIDLDRSRQPFIAKAMLACALAGHPFRLLRPPSFVA